MMRGLLIDDVAKQKVERVLDYALMPEHWYRPEKDARVPGDDPRFTAHLEHGYRCVFTITESPRGPFRHLSISVPGEKYPSILAAYTIAEMFGFTGWDGRSEELPHGWAAMRNKDEQCVVMAQAYVLNPVGAVK